MCALPSAGTSEGGRTWPSDPGGGDGGSSPPEGIALYRGAGLMAGASLGGGTSGAQTSTTAGSIDGCLVARQRTMSDIDLVRDEGSTAATPYL